MGTIAPGTIQDGYRFTGGDRKDRLNWEPQPGVIQDGYRFKGGDRHTSANWEPVGADTSDGWYPEADSSQSSGFEDPSKGRGLSLSDIASSRAMAHLPGGSVLGPVVQRGLNYLHETFSPETTMAANPESRAYQAATAPVVDGGFAGTVINQSAQVAPNFVHGLAAAPNMAANTVAQGAQAFGDVTGWDGLQHAGQWGQDQIQSAQKDPEHTFDAQDWGAGKIAHLGGTITSFATPIGRGLGVSTMAAESGLGGFNEARKEGIGVGGSLAYGTAQGASTALTLGLLGKVNGLYTPTKGLLKEGAFALVKATAAGTEATVTSNMLRNYLTDKVAEANGMDPANVQHIPLLQGAIDQIMTFGGFELNSAMHRVNAAKGVEAAATTHPEGMDGYIADQQIKVNSLEAADKVTKLTTKQKGELESAKMSLAIATKMAAGHPAPERDTPVAPDLATAPESTQGFGQGAAPDMRMEARPDAANQGSPAFTFEQKEQGQRAIQALEVQAVWAKSESDRNEKLKQAEDLKAKLADAGIADQGRPAPASEAFQQKPGGTVSQEGLIRDTMPDVMPGDESHLQEAVAQQGLGNRDAMPTIPGQDPYRAPQAPVDIGVEAAKPTSGFSEPKPVETTPTPADVPSVQPPQSEPPAQPDAVPAKPESADAGAIWKDPERMTRLDVMSPELKSLLGRIDQGGETTTLDLLKGVKGAAPREAMLANLKTLAEAKDGHLGGQIIRDGSKIRVATDAEWASIQNRTEKPLTDGPAKPKLQKKTATGPAADVAHTEVGGNPDLKENPSAQSTSATDRPAAESTTDKRERFVAGRLDRAGDEGVRLYTREGGTDAERVRGIEATYTASPEFAKSLGESGYPDVKLHELAKTPENANSFLEKITASKDGSKFGAAVYLYPAEDYGKMRLFHTPDGKSGFAVKEDGDIVSVFSDGGGKVAAMLSLAVEQGGTKLDCFDTVLPKIYAVNGFKEVSRDKWNDEYTPTGWDKKTFSDFNNGEPDVVYMEYDKNYSPFGDTDTKPAAAEAKPTEAVEPAPVIPKPADMPVARVKDVVDRIKGKLKDSREFRQRGALGDQPANPNPIDIHDLHDLGAALWHAGHTTYSEFSKEARAQIKEIFDGKIPHWAAAQMRTLHAWTQQAMKTIAANNPPVFDGKPMDPRDIFRMRKLERDNGFNRADRREFAARDTRITSAWEDESRTMNPVERMDRFSTPETANGKALIVDLMIEQSDTVKNHGPMAFNDAGAEGYANTLWQQAFSKFGKALQDAGRKGPTWGEVFQDLASGAPSTGKSWGLAKRASGADSVGGRESVAVARMIPRIIEAAKNYGVGSRLRITFADPNLQVSKEVRRSIDVNRRVPIEFQVRSHCKHTPRFGTCSSSIVTIIFL